MNPWSVFWRQGHSTTFGDYFKQGYDGAIASWWRGHVDALEPGATVLELGCGNCSLLPFLVSAQCKATYIGVDLATVAISDVAKEGLEDSEIEVIVHQETPAEDLPLGDKTVDVIAAVFGIEYSDLDKSLAEAQRVLKPGGKLVALLHHDESVVTSMSRRALSEYDEADFQSAVGALETVSRARDETPDISRMKDHAEAEASRAEINRLADKYLRDTNPATANATMFEFMTNALNFFRMMETNSETRARFINQLQTEHLASRERFDQMVSVALDKDDVETLREKLSDLGFVNTDVDVVYNNNDILGWELCTEKPLSH